MKRLRLLEEKRNEYEMTYRKKNDFERVERGAIIRVGNRGKTKRERISQTARVKTPSSGPKDP